MDDISYGEDSFSIPSNIKDDMTLLYDIISPDTWNNILTDKHRKKLMVSNFIKLHNMHY